MKQFELSKIIADGLSLFKNNNLDIVEGQQFVQ